MCASNHVTFPVSGVGKDNLPTRSAAASAGCISAATAARNIACCTGRATKTASADAARAGATAAYISKIDSIRAVIVDVST
jgi:hypothetical protein